MEGSMKGGSAGGTSHQTWLVGESSETEESEGADISADIYKTSRSMYT